MDEFFSSLNVVFFQKWILSHHNPDLIIKMDTNDRITIDNQSSSSTITFYHDNIIELTTINKSTGQTEFYLHFQMQSLLQAVNLFDEMVICIQKIAARPAIRVLLCCSGGLTTSFFANKLHQGIELLDLHFTIDATGYQNVFYQGNQYDVILLAPQISHVYHKVKAVLKSQAVRVIPGEIFATYDVKAAIDLITAAYARKTVPPRKTNALTIHQKVDNKSPVLVFSLFRNSQRVHLAYRLYEKDMNIVIDDEIIKPHVKADDIFHVIDTILVNYPDIETIGISTPGIINDDGLLSSTSVRGFENIYLEKMLKERYTANIVIANDVNTAAVGFYACQDKCDSLAFLFQPIHHLSGAGIVINGNLVKGSHNLAGEIQYLPMALSNSPMILNRTIEGSLELAGKTIMSIMALLAPEVVVVYCDLITNEDRLYDELGRHLQKSYLPKIIKVTNMLDYTLLGQLILSC